MSCNRNFEGICCQAAGNQYLSQFRLIVTKHSTAQSEIPKVLSRDHISWSLSVKIGADLQLQMRPSLHTSKSNSKKKQFHPWILLCRPSWRSLYTVMHSLNLSLLCMSHARFFVHLLWMGEIYMFRSCLQMVTVLKSLQLQLRFPQS